ncbi:unnamed protein product [Prorocentrum cordatum]|uniref:Uncharacterized protein n=1 Tax=Prorocentrum cordatum TaxID=2364126 RepID=A0ABN9PS07_9DINO|nr:unnamed protein product [Polarella glacialis]
MRNKRPNALAKKLAGSTSEHTEFKTVVPAPLAILMQQPGVETNSDLREPVLTACTREAARDVRPPGPHPSARTPGPRPLESGPHWDPCRGPRQAALRAVSASNRGGEGPQNAASVDGAAALPHLARAHAARPPAGRRGVGCAEASRRRAAHGRRYEAG